MRVMTILLVVTVLAGALLLVGCGRPPLSGAPTVTSNSPAISSPSSSASAPESFSTTSAALPAGWHRLSNASLSIALPSNWNMINLGAESAQAIFDEVKKISPKMAQMVGDPSTFQKFAFWAFARPSEGSPFVDNLNIQKIDRLASNDISSPDDLLVWLTEQYQSVGFQITESTGGLTIADLPAAYVRYLGAVNGASITGQQYLLLTDSALLILSYTFGNDSAALFQGLAKTSAETFVADQ